MLHAVSGSINVKARTLGEEKRVVLTLAIGATLIAAALIGVSIWVLFAAGALKADTVGLTNLLTWAGLRGGLAIAMALSLPASPEKGLILHMTYGVVAFAIIVQGLTVGRIFKSDRLAGLLK